MRALFIVGTGRSGTHFTCRLLSGFDNVRDPFEGREDARLLRAVAGAALRHASLPERALRHYRRQLDAAGAGGVFIDQHHPNLFHVDQLLGVCPDLVFLFPDRPVPQVVASMLRHAGVLSWYRRRHTWFAPFPNRFLGIGRRADVRQMPLHLLCAHRVIGHKRRAIELSRRLPGVVRVVDYPGLVRDPTAELARVFAADERARLGAFELREKPSPASLDKYRSVLEPEQVDEILALERTLLGDAADTGPAAGTASRSRPV